MKGTVSAGTSKTDTSSRSGAEAPSSEIAPVCLSPAHIAALIKGYRMLAIGDEVALCMEVLRRSVFTVSAPVATGLDYPPFALSPGESGSLALRVLEGTAVVVYRLGARRTLSAEVVERLTEAISEAMRELACESNPPAQLENPARLCDS